MGQEEEECYLLISTKGPPEELFLTAPCVKFDESTNPSFEPDNAKASEKKKIFELEDFFFSGAGFGFRLKILEGDSRVSIGFNGSKREEKPPDCGFQWFRRKGLADKIAGVRRMVVRVEASGERDDTENRGFGDG
ncbi:hypothetical protein U1Q18_036816, partial [Sarracenia purpurea var. burkii]